MTSSSSTTRSATAKCGAAARDRAPNAGFPLVGLALCVLAIGTGEYVVAGMLPEVATGLRVGIPAAGQLVTVYAATVMLAGPLLTAATARRPVKGMLLVLMAVFVAGTLGCAAAPSFSVLVGARVVAALAHCTTFAVALVVATSLVSPERAARAIGAVAAGLTLATVVGVPVGTVVADLLGWRATFVLVAVLAALGWVVVAAVLPRQSAPAPQPVARQVRVLLRPAVAGLFGLTVLGYAGVFTAFTYLAPLIRQHGHTAATVTIVVTAFGLGGVAGNAIAARTTDGSPRATLLTALSLLSVTLVTLPAVVHVLPLLVAVVLVFGAAAFATVPGLQARVIAVADGAPALAAATNVAAFNLANTVGAGFGGLVAAGAGQLWTGPAGGAISLLGLIAAGLLLPRSVDTMRGMRATGGQTDGATA